MQDLRQRLDAGGKPRAWAREVAVGRKSVDPIAANSRDHIPLVGKSHGAVFVASLRRAIAAGRDQQYFGDASTMSWRFTRNEGLRALPKTSTPPARSIISGTQCPPT